MSTNININPNNKMLEEKLKSNTHGKSMQLTEEQRLEAEQKPELEQEREQD
jgi:hypothetical protein